VDDVDRIRGERDIETLQRMATTLVRENKRLVTRILTLQKELARAKGSDKAQLELEIAALEKELAAVNKTSGNPEEREAGTHVWR
jgi:hypothetical protein